MFSNKMSLFFHCWILQLYAILHFAFYQLKQRHILKRLIQELENVPFSPFSTPTTKNCDRYVLTVAPIIDFLYVLKSVAKQLGRMEI
jgi:hypothetical protein